MKIFMTGGTGLIGKALIKGLYPSADLIYITVRAQSIKMAKKEFCEFEKIIFVSSDIIDDRIVLDDELEKEIIENVDVVIHCAGLYNLKSRYQDSYMVNIIGTQNICCWAKKLKKLKYFHYFSTIAVAGEMEGLFKESDINERAKFSNNYAETKMSAELIVRRCDFENVKKRIYRPGIVIGSTLTGEIEKIDGPYYFLKLLRKLTLKNSWFKKIPIFFLPYNSKIYFPVIPIDQLISWISFMVLKPSSQESIRVYHLLNPKYVKLHDFLVKSFNFYGVKAKLRPIQTRKSFGKIARGLGLPDSILNYMNNHIRYDISQREEDFPCLENHEFGECSNIIFKGADQYFSGEIQ